MWSYFAAYMYINNTHYKFQGDPTVFTYLRHYKWTDLAIFRVVMALRLRTLDRLPKSLPEIGSSWCWLASRAVGSGDWQWSLAVVSSPAAGTVVGRGIFSQASAQYGQSYMHLGAPSSSSKRQWQSASLRWSLSCSSRYWATKALYRYWSVRQKTVEFMLDQFWNFQFSYWGAYF